MPKDATDDEPIRRKVKAELRKRMRSVRNAAPLSSCTERSRLIVASLEAHECMGRARAVALFWPILDRHEVDLRALDGRLRARGVRVAYPAIEPETSIMTFRFVADVTTLAECGRGFAEPPPDALRVNDGELDVVVVPALAIDPVGHRIGYGAGYYDRTLPRFAPPAELFGVAFDYQLIVEVPVTAGDIAMTWVATDTRLFRAEV
jgi:5-formyltetrahydrofolate cyclo-ligase